MILFDIDGTLVNSYDRVKKFLIDPVSRGEPKDWDGYDYSWPMDTPINSMIQILHLVNRYKGANNWGILTGRNVRTLNLTMDQFQKYNLPWPNLVMMRAKNDHRPADVVKLELLKKYGFTPESVTTYFEDDIRVVKALREAGYHVCDVAGGRYGENDPAFAGGR